MAENPAPVPPQKPKAHCMLGSCGLSSSRSPKRKGFLRILGRDGDIWSIAHAGPLHPLQRSARAERETIALERESDKGRERIAMSSVLQRTSRDHNRNEADDGNLSSLPSGAPAALPLLVAPSSASTMVEDAPSRGVPLLTKGKQFHLAQRGLKETSGFWYISKLPKR